MLSRVGRSLFKCESRLNIISFVFVLDLSKLPQIEVTSNIAYEDILKVRNIVT